MDGNQVETAVKLFPRIYNTAQEWEEQIHAFIGRNKLDVNRYIRWRFSSDELVVDYHPAYPDNQTKTRSKDLRGSIDHLPHTEEL